jgi:hypothetical protein
MTKDDIEEIVDYIQIAKTMNERQKINDNLAIATLSNISV